MTVHLCHAEGCPIGVPPARLMCLTHWRMVPRPLQRAVWHTYVPGQETRKDPTAEYLDAAEQAVRAVAYKEGRRVRACRQCGCTDDRACAGGCSWVDLDLCSACTPAKAAAS